MLTRLKFKNWRSLKDVVIDDLQPITVFIGANSSGKSNILDALYFLRDGVADDPFEEIVARGEEENVRTIGVGATEDIGLELSFQPDKSDPVELTYSLTEKIEMLDPYQTAFWFEEILSDSNDKRWLEANNGERQYAQAWQESREVTRNEPNPTLGLLAFGRMSAYPYVQQTFRYITERWQLLDEGFSARMSVASGQKADLYVLDRCGDNLATVLEFMQRKHHQLYDNLAEDVRWLLSHVDGIGTEQTERETRVYLNEKGLGREAPIVSAGTRRLIAILTAYYALDMRYPEMPGLVVIEEPDTALNPGLLRRFVDLLRTYTEGEHPRQFILTTHNPAFLDYFEPEEIRIVERDDENYTQVRRLPDSIRERWLTDMELGDVWRTNTFGGLP